jgi:hypothetical protein
MLILDSPYEELENFLRFLTQAILVWIRAAAEEIKDEELPTAEVVQVDEMWHFINKKTKFGCGERFAGYHAELSDGTSVIVLTQV